MTDDSLGGLTGDWAAERAFVLAKLQTFEGLVLDADGVWFDGNETRTHASNDEPGLVSISKTRDFRDGQGLSFLRAMGIRVLFATGEGEPLSSIVQKLNELPSCRSGFWTRVDLLMSLKSGKAEAVATWAKANGIELAKTIYIGDDRTDCEAMKLVRDRGGLVVVPSDAQRVVIKYSHLTLGSRGGAGAVREFAERVCDARGIDEEGLATA